MAEALCNICGDLKNDKFMYKLNCGHDFHYECILKTFLLSTNKLCPLCRTYEDSLPIINGLKKIKLLNQLIFMVIAIIQDI